MATYDDGDDFGAQPHDIDAEQQVLGGMLYNRAQIPAVSENMTPGEHYRPAHGLIHEAILYLYNLAPVDGNPVPVDAITVKDELIRRGEITRIGTPTYLHDLMHNCGNPGAAGYFARKVAWHAARRRMIETGSSISQIGREPGGLDDPGQLYSRAQDLTHRLNTGDRTRDKTMVRLADLMVPTMLEVEAIGNRTASTLPGVPTGFEDLDALTYGLHGGQLIVVGARPAVGKSTLALDWSRSAAIKHGMTSVIFSLEMGRLEVAMRALSAEARINLHALRGGRLNDDEWTRLARRMGQMHDAPLWVDDSPTQSLMDIRTKCLRMKEQHDLRFVVVDYLQLMTTGRRAESRQQEVSEMSRFLKVLAKELDVPVVALSQLNRGSEHRTDGLPRMSDLRESGAVEQDADVVILLHREDANTKESPRAGEADLIIAKHRNGPTATVTVAFQGHYSRFVDMAPA